MKPLEKAAKFINEANTILITTGAGMSVDSGLPDFRGNEGFWKNYPLAKKMGLKFEEMSTTHWFKTNPKLAYGFWAHRYNLYKDKKPHKGYKILQEICSKKDNYFIFTSNVDGHFLHDFPDEKVYECHGSIQYWQCYSEICSLEIFKFPNERIPYKQDPLEGIEPFPTCKLCREPLRPNVLMFNDYSFNNERMREKMLLYNDWKKKLKELKSEKLLKLCVIEIGAGLHVPTVRNESEMMTSNFQGNFIRINPRDFQVPRENHVSLNMNGLEALQEISKILI